MIRLRQSTASQEVPLGPFVDSTDGVTAETALSIANTDIKLWVAGATTLANKNSGGATHISGGIYYCVLDATDTATIGPLVLFVAVTGALAVRLECEVLDEAMYDHLFGTNPPLSPTTAGRTLDVTATGAAGIDWGNVENPTTSLNLSATSVQTATNVETDTQDIQARLPAALVSGRIDASVGAMAAAVVTAAAVATGAIDADAIATDAVAELQAGLATAAALATAQSSLDSQASSLATIAGYLDTEIAAILAAVDTEVAAIKAKTDLLPASPAATGDIPSAASVADAVWDEAIAGHASAGSTAATLSARATQASLDIIDAIVDAIVVDTQDIQSRLPAALVSGRIDASVGAVAANAITSAAVADGAIDAAALATDAGNKIADHVLRRSLATALSSANGDTKAFRSLAGAVAKLVNRVAVVAGTLSVYETDDATALGTQAVTSDANADPITAVDTA